MSFPVALGWVLVQVMVPGLEMEPALVLVPVLEWRRLPVRR